ncbi:hypothetical protein RHS01_11430 [Rhizoctonia solani]|uniref:Uncharacterized protein n=1 Tax=Rhizoctonia solani TaxID=456999 RepID=A0A8H7I1Z3_9AGAM|nr:hypothetical protein RHS01_11430 [Rhizoctonia solani]
MSGAFIGWNRKYCVWLILPALSLTARPSSFLLHTRRSPTPLPPPPDDERPRGQRDADSKTSSQITQDAARWFNVIDAECSKSYIITGLQVTEHQTGTRRSFVEGEMSVARSGLDAYGADHGPQQFAPLARRAVVIALVQAVSCYEVGLSRLWNDNCRLSWTTPLDTAKNVAWRLEVVALDTILPADSDNGWVRPLLTEGRPPPRESRVPSTQLLVTQSEHLTSIPRRGYGSTS